MRLLRAQIGEEGHLQGAGELRRTRKVQANATGERESAESEKDFSRVESQGLMFEVGSSEFLVEEHE